MKRHLKLIGIAAVTALLLLGVSAAVAGPPAPIVGHWSAPDTYDYDGSVTRMTITNGPGGVYKLFASDNPSTSGCPITNGLAFIKGTATFDASTNIITKTVQASCPSEGTSYPPATHDMVYDPVTDTIHDTNFNLTYSR